MKTSAQGDTTLLKDFLKSVNVLELQNRISYFRDLDFKKLSDDEIASHVLDVICFTDKNNRRLAAQLNRNHTFDVGTRFYRVRKIDGNDLSIPVAALKSKADVWEPPTQFARGSRINRNGEPLLYISPSMQIAMEETKTAIGDRFVVIVYEATKEIQVREIGARMPDNDLTDEEKIKLNMLVDFHRHEFLREVGSGTEHFYKISRILAQRHCRLEEQTVGWLYPSVAKKGGINLCLKPDAIRDKLQFKGLIVADGVEVDGVFRARVDFVSAGYDDTEGKFVYDSTESAIAKDIFPEIFNTATV